MRSDRQLAEGVLEGDGKAEGEGLEGVVKKFKFKPRKRLKFVIKRGIIEPTRR